MKNSTTSFERIKSGLEEARRHRLAKADGDEPSPKKSVGKLDNLPAREDSKTPALILQATPLSK